MLLMYFTSRLYLISVIYGRPGWSSVRFHLLRRGVCAFRFGVALASELDSQGMQSGTKISIRFRP